MAEELIRRAIHRRRSEAYGWSGVVDQRVVTDDRSMVTDHQAGGHRLTVVTAGDRAWVLTLRYTTLDGGQWQVVRQGGSADRLPVHGDHPSPAIYSPAYATVVCNARSSCAPSPLPRLLPRERPATCPAACLAVAVLVCQDSRSLCTAACAVDDVVTVELLPLVHRLAAAPARIAVLVQGQQPTLVGLVRPAEATLCGVASPCPPLPVLACARGHGYLVMVR
jgi:hypothetical protein